MLHAKLSIHFFELKKTNPNLFILGINHKDKKEDAIKYLKDDGNPYDFVGVDTDGLIAMDFGVFGLPETFLINEDGKIIYKFMGPLTEKIIKDEIEPLLSFFLKLIFFKLIFISMLNASENLDNKVKKLTLELRCMTCQNQSVHDSDADFSNDIRKIVKKKV